MVYLLWGEHEGGFDLLLQGSLLECNAQLSDNWHDDPGQFTGFYIENEEGDIEHWEGSCVDNLDVIDSYCLMH